jgi:hypothetical protein
MFRHQLMQRAHPHQPLQQPPPGQHLAGVILELDVVMGFGPIVPDEQHPVSSP